MPNHVTNELTASKKVLDSLASNDGPVDFNTVVPMPEAMRDLEPNCAVVDWAKVALGVVKVSTLNARGDAVAAFERGDYGAAADVLHRSNLIRMLVQGPFPKDFAEKEFNDLLRCMRCLKETGYAYWYDWSPEKWGTKWNAYEAKRVSDDKVTFQTAWSMPSKWLESLSKKFPKNRIRMRWADEDFGNNVGDVTVLNGEIVAGGRLTNDTPESHALACELIYGGTLPDDMRWVDGKVEYLETEA